MLSPSAVRLHLRQSLWERNGCSVAVSAVFWGGRRGFSRVRIPTVARAHRGFCLVCFRDLSELLADTALVPVRMALFEYTGHQFERMRLWARAGNYFRRQHLPVFNALPSTRMSRCRHLRLW